MLIIVHHEKSNDSSIVKVAYLENPSERMDVEEENFSQNFPPGAHELVA